MERTIPRFASISHPLLLNLEVDGELFPTGTSLRTRASQELSKGSFIFTLKIHGASSPHKVLHREYTGTW
jgi:hypothetical protein